MHVAAYDHCPTAEPEVYLTASYVVVNSGMSAFTRVDYDDASFDRLFGRLRSSPNVSVYIVPLILQ